MKEYTKTPISIVVQKFETNQGAHIYQIPINAFPGFWVYAYLVFVDEYVVLIDTGSNLDQSNESLEEGFRQVTEITGQEFSPTNLTHIFITHGHIDHYAGLAYLENKTGASIGIHDLDRRTVTNFGETLNHKSLLLRLFLEQSGVRPETTQEIINMYRMPKALFTSARIDFSFEEIGMKLGPFEFLHVPGHCAGMVVTKLHNVLFSADHVLEDISPHQSPESLAPHTGLGHYLSSLQATADWATEIDMTLGSHNAPITNLSKRIKAIQLEHAERLNKIIKLMDSPKTIAQISNELFGQVDGYNVLLALEETGAHVEYLYSRGFLGIENHGKLLNGSKMTPLIYSRNVEDYDFYRYLLNA